MNSHHRRTRPEGERPVIEIMVDGPATDGASVGRDDDGRAVFCEGALPGETVQVQLHTEKKRFARGRVVEVLDASEGRIDPSCATHAAGCGGCNLAHATPALQQQIKVRVVADALIRIGRLDHDLVHELLSADRGPTVPVDVRGYRTTARLSITEGRAGYRRRASHDVVSPSMCGVVHPLVEEMILAGQYEDRSGSEVVLRTSVATGERIAVVNGEKDGANLPSGVTVTDRESLAAGQSVFMTERAGARDWQVSAGSFFQAGPDVATALVDAVTTAAGPVSGAVVVDAYAGIGLFGGTVGASAEQVISVEQSSSSTRDARVNLKAIRASIVETAVENWTSVAADVVIADPARSGLGAKGVSTLDRCQASRFVLVSCDSGALGRDIGLLVERGYSLESVQVIDAFPDTSHVETVVALTR